VSEPVQYTLKLPPDINRWVSERAKQNLRSKSAEIVFVLRAEMKAAGEEFGDKAPAAAPNAAVDAAR
jgi:hypothetical protein